MCCCCCWRLCAWPARANVGLTRSPLTRPPHASRPFSPSSRAEPRRAAPRSSKQGRRVLFRCVGALRWRWGRAPKTQKANPPPASPRTTHSHSDRLPSAIVSRKRAPSSLCVSHSHTHTLSHSLTQTLSHSLTHTLSHSHTHTHSHSLSLSLIVSVRRSHRKEEPRCKGREMLVSSCSFEHAPPAAGRNGFGRGSNHRRQRQEAQRERERARKKGRMPPPATHARAPLLGCMHASVCALPQVPAPFPIPLRGACLAWPGLAFRPHFACMYMFLVKLSLPLSLFGAAATATKCVPARRTRRRVGKGRKPRPARRGPGPFAEMRLCQESSSAALGGAAKPNPGRVWGRQAT